MRKDRWELVIYVLGVIMAVLIWAFVVQPGFAASGSYLYPEGAGSEVLAPSSGAGSEGFGIGSELAALYGCDFGDTSASEGDSSSSGVIQEQQEEPFDFSSGDGSGGLDPERDPEAPPLDYNTGEAGVPSGYGSEIEDEPEEDESDGYNTGEAGVPSGYGSEIEDELEEDEPDGYNTGEAGVPSGEGSEIEDEPEEDEPDGYNTGEAGVPETEGAGFYYAPGEVAPLVISPGEAAGVPEENGDATDSEEEIGDGENVNQSEAGEESGNAGEIGGIVDTLDNIRLTMVFLLGSLWALGGVLLAFEIGRSVA